MAAQLKPVFEFDSIANGATSIPLKEVFKHLSSYLAGNRANSHVQNLGRATASGAPVPLGRATNSGQFLLGLLMGLCVLAAFSLDTFGIIVPSVFDAIFSLIWGTLNQGVIYFIMVACLDNNRALRIFRGKFGLARIEITSIWKFRIFL
jgi:hypothetical protein